MTHAYAMFDEKGEVMLESIRKMDPEVFRHLPKEKRAPVPVFVGRWMPIASAPRDGTWVLGINNRGNRAVIIWKDNAPNWMGEGFASGWIHPFSDGTLSAFWNGGCGSVATHWMPLPPVPAGEG